MKLIVDFGIFPRSIWTWQSLSHDDVNIWLLQIFSGHDTQNLYRGHLVREVKWGAHTISLKGFRSEIGSSGAPDTFPQILLTKRHKYPCRSLWKPKTLNHSNASRVCSICSYTLTLTRLWRKYVFNDSSCERWRRVMTYLWVSMATGTHV